MKTQNKSEIAGDKLFAKKKYKEALTKYREALAENPDNVDLYDKLIETRNQVEDNWELADFIETVTWTMKKQELKEPEIKQVHAKLSPEWGQATDLIMKIILADEKDKKLPDLINEIINLGETGTRALVDILRNFVKKNRDKETRYKKQDTNNNQ